MAAGPLSIALKTAATKTEVPKVADGTQTLLVLKSLTQDRNDKGDFLKFEWVFKNPTPMADGSVVAPGQFGSTKFEQIPLYAKADAKNPEWFLEKIAKRIDALLGTGDDGNKAGKPTRPDLDASVVSAMIGKEVVAKFKHREFEGVTRDEIDTVTFPGDVAM